ncbi:MAG: hypothetical protein COW08_01705 [Ignavibacteriales bacterium CG12_big_fil_rev_8_21_14_0_65_30_8]|nr:MAG: hypothetical protein COW08_01705 [Ignavibacteriales bacterium CG12_big_fil_rev_8_21_14_0_65_30_8]
MNNIAIVGAGQLGSRYLQGLARIDIPINIQVVDTNDKSLDLAKERYFQLPFNSNVRSISFHKRIDDLNHVLDLIILATNADHRFGITRELLTTKSIKYLILEKVLFQRLDEYNQIEKLLKKHDVPCWINHPRRLYPFYQSLKENLKSEKQLNFNVQGGNWGLACNGLHFIDLISFLVDSDKLTIDTDYLNDKIYQSKRPGYIEIQGLLSGKIGENVFTLYSNEEPGLHIISIASDHFRYVIDEAKGMIWESSVYDQWQWKEKHEKIVFNQSEISHNIVEEIIRTGSSGLPTYEAAAALHKPFISSLLEYYNQISNETHVRLPIT